MIGDKQVHLDFHTSELIPGVGEQFNKQQFQHALQLAGVDSITLFAKCHHSWCYYPTQVGQVHPHLKRNLLKEQMEAAHEIGMRAPVYITFGWSANDAMVHPEWVARRRDGSLRSSGRAENPLYDEGAAPDDPRPCISWLNLFPHPGYVEHLEAITREICQQFDRLDGLFFDIFFNVNGIDYSAETLAAVAEAGMDPESDMEVIHYNEQLRVKTEKKLKAILLEFHPDATIFFNGSAELGAPELFESNTHFELEDLPTFWGGYDKLPLVAKYFSQQDHKPYLSMSGKFHTMWGEFGGYKHPDAITYEVANAVAFGARCSFGDQLHPCGKMDLATYRNIGAGYAYFDRVAPYGIEGGFYSDLGLLLSGDTENDQGVCSMLLEEHLEFEIALPTGDWGRYKTIIVPNGPLGDPDLHARLQTYLKTGGTVLALHKAGLNEEQDDFSFSCGADFLGAGRFLEDYSLVGGEVGRELPDSPFFNYESVIRVELHEDTESLGKIYEPYFDRTYEKYCSHRNAPYQTAPADHPLGWRAGGLVYLAHPLGSIYKEYGARVHRQLFRNALDLIYREPMIQIKLPSTARISLRHQPEQKRYCLHLLFSPPIKRGQCEVIEDFPPLYKVEVAVRLQETVKEVRLALTDAPIPFMLKKGRIIFAVPEIKMHSIVCLQY